MKKVKEWLNKHEWLILIIGLIVILRIPSLFEPHNYGDEEIYFVMGHGWREGLSFYRDIFDHKPPLIYILAGLSRSVFGFRLLLMLGMIGETICFWKLSGWIWQQFERLKKRKQTWLQIISTIIFAILSSLPLLEGLVANGELFMMMPLVAALAWLASKKKKRSRDYLVAGLVAGIGFLVKIPVAFDFLAIMLFFFPFQETKFSKALKSLFRKDFWLMGVGFLTPMAITFAIYYLRGLGPDFVKGVFLINFGYTSSYATSSYKFNPLASGLLIRFELLVLFSGWLFAVRKKINRGYLLISLWFGFSLFGALLSDRPYPHYLQEVVPVGSLWLASILVLEDVWSWLIWGSLALSLVIAQKKIKFWHYPTLSYYANFVKVLSGRESKQKYLDYFATTRINFPIAKFLKDRMVKTDSLYVWGTDPTLYNLLNRLPTGGKYIVSFHVRDFKAYDETIHRLKKNKPDYVVILPQPIPFPALFSWLEAKYVQIGEIKGAKIYKRL